MTYTRYWILQFYVSLQNTTMQPQHVHQKVYQSLYNLQCSLSCQLVRCIGSFSNVLQCFLFFHAKTPIYRVDSPPRLIRFVPSLKLVRCREFSHSLLYSSLDPPAFDTRYAVCWFKNFLLSLISFHPNLMIAMFYAQAFKCKIKQLAVLHLS